MAVWPPSIVTGDTLTVSAIASKLNVGELPSGPVRPAASVQLEENDKPAPSGPVYVGIGVHAMLPETVSDGGVTMNETDPTYHPF